MLDSVDWKWLIYRNSIAAAQLSSINGEKRIFVNKHISISLSIPYPHTESDAVIHILCHLRWDRRYSIDASELNWFPISEFRNCRRNAEGDNMALPQHCYYIQSKLWLIYCSIDIDFANVGPRRSPLYFVWIKLYVDSS